MPRQRFKDNEPRKGMKTPSCALVLCAGGKQQGLSVFVPGVLTGYSCLASALKPLTPFCTKKLLIQWYCRTYLFVSARKIGWV